jgi:predicted CopG family antitoxin
MNYSEYLKAKYGSDKFADVLRKCIEERKK